MALKNCPECKSEISDSAYECPKCGKILRKLRRGPIGFIFKWLFILFNAFMLYCAVVGMNATSETIKSATSTAEQAGAAIGAGLGMTMILSIWGFGAVILGLFVLFTKPTKK